VEPNKKYYFALPFEEHLRKLLNGWKPPTQFKSKKAATAPQLQLIKKLGYTGKPPETSGDASELITRLKR
jgi:hypothetical protein